ncbi:MAG: putative cyclohydrolase 1 type 2, partial [Frankiales bacterium]|nr:putative cyclohydrolase 1 type 2 [Frankiales bacterium]
MGATLGDVVAALDRLFPPALAEPWDSIGLVLGDPASEVRSVLFAVDPVEALLPETVGHQLLVTHHPLWLGGTGSMAATDPKGRFAHALVTSGCGLLVAHTNADRANPGVSDALAARFDLRDTVPLEVAPDPVDKLVFFVPVADAQRVTDAVTAAGGGRLGDYDCCSWSTTGTGSFRPLAGARPAVGSVGERESVEEVRVETLVRRTARAQVVQALLQAHPYETPAYDVVPLADLPSAQGLGRVGDLPEPTRLGDLVELAARVLPATAWGVRASGDPEAVVGRLAVMGGSGSDAMGLAARAGAQAFLTSDLKHHNASEAPEALALIDAAHWATEHPWLHPAAASLARVVDVETA